MNIMTNNIDEIFEFYTKMVSPVLAKLEDGSVSEGDLEQIRTIEIEINKFLTSKYDIFNSDTNNSLEEIVLKSQRLSQMEVFFDSLIILLNEMKIIKSKEKLHSLKFLFNNIKQISKL